MPARVAIASCRWTVEAGSRALDPDPDADALIEAFARAGAEATRVAWDDTHVDWTLFSHVLVSSTWDGIDRLDSYLSWMHRLAGSAMLVNDLPTLVWGLDKVHQRGLAALGVPIIPTIWLPPGTPLPELCWPEVVAKPSLSAGARGTARYRADDHRLRDHVRTLHGEGQLVMVQPHLASVAENGEVDLVFLGGAFSHAVKKNPMLDLGVGVRERPWTHMTWSGLYDPDEAEMKLASRVVDLVATQTGAVPPYCRIDLLRGERAEPLLLEVEVVDPYLSFDLLPSAADALVRAALQPRSPRPSTARRR